jgi:diguanylate cyclase (GGDEF)-like protein
MQLVWLYEPDATLAAEMERELTGAGYRVHGISHWRALQSQARQEPPTAFVVDWDAARETFHPEELMHLIELREERYTLPILFLSSRDDFVARLDAVRHGATAYLIKPMPVTALLEMIEIQTGNSNRDPYRILIIEDEETLAALYASFLESDGMFTQRITDPLQVMSALVDFRPDLILSDVNMPNLSGLELAAVLRQQEAYQSIPIVYLSGETDTTKQLLALHLGGDDFLIKPIEPSHLISKVASRVQRARILRRLAEHDSLTGLLDHSHLKEQLAIQVSRARRTQTALSFAMLDLDHFKAVNDMFGHLVGDRLLKSTARLLRQHLRDTDTVGRCGGEEFGIIFPDTDAPSALHLTREICSRLAQTCHRTGEIDFNVTVSAGVASLSCYADALALTEAADRALYLAKCSGRNQVVSADNIDSNWVGHNTKGVCSAAFTEIRR